MRDSHPSVLVRAGVYGFVDTLEKSGQEDFTALGQLFFVHNDLEHVR